MRTLVVLLTLTLLLSGCVVAAPVATPVPPTSVPPTPISEGRFVVPGGGQMFIAVERTMFDVLMTSVDNRDPRPLDLALDTGSALMIDSGTRVRVLRRDGRVAQFEILDGRYAGRAGWQYASLLAP